MHSRCLHLYKKHARLIYALKSLVQLILEFNTVLKRHRRDSIPSLSLRRGAVYELFYCADPYAVCSLNTIVKVYQV